MRKLIFTGLLAFTMLLAVDAQDYKTGIGFRGGFDNGITIKHFITRSSALEGIIASRWRGLELIGLYEIHATAFDTERLNWYFGGGAHIGFWDGDHAVWGDEGSNYAVIGVDGIIGIEYNFKAIPVNLSLDWKPALNLVGYSGFWGDGGALSVRYIF
ncbi:MAG: hypothetical protein RBU28_01235 [Bacteroidales bacterium]|jgi:hypothetical protein|nr:hypothetical protein [Bacteroidales bacterium]